LFITRHWRKSDAGTTYKKGLQTPVQGERRKKLSTGYGMSQIGIKI
jgi:hypothetical protein